MAVEYILTVYRTDASEAHVLSYKLTGISTLESAYAVLADYETNHCPSECKGLIVIVQSEYPFWNTFFRHKGELQ